MRGRLGARMNVNWRKLPTVLTMDEILDKAFSRGRKAADRVDDPVKIFRVRKQLTRMVQTSADVMAEYLDETMRTWPSLDQMSIFDVAMVDACVSCDEYRHQLSILGWGAKQIRNISRQNVRKLTRSGRTEVMHEARREAYGRISSIMRRIDKPLQWLNDSRQTLRKLPVIDELHPTIVVCGAPNVGKSAFISSLSSGNMEVNHYPITTKQLHVGHFEHRRLKYQMVDTPGLLDRAMEVRNDIEMQAIAAIKHIGSICLFIIDPSEQCGLSVDDQLNLKSEVEGLLGDVEIITVTSKADLMEPRPANWDAVLQSEAEWDGEGEPQLEMLIDSLGELTMSVTHEIGVNALRLELIRRCRSKMIDDPMSLPEGWHRQ